MLEFCDDQMLNSQIISRLDAGFVPINIEVVTPIDFTLCRVSSSNPSIRHFQIL